jgi:hypothetical protein
MGQIKLTTALVMIGLFSIAIISFALNFAIDNDAAVSIADDSEISDLTTGISGNMSAFRAESESSYSSILNTTIDPGSLTVPSTAPFAITPGSALNVARNILSIAYQKIFGTNSGFSIFLVSLIAVIVFMLGLFIYKTLRGNPD